MANIQDYGFGDERPIRNRAFREVLNMMAQFKKRSNWANLCSWICDYDKLRAKIKDKLVE